MMMMGGIWTRLFIVMALIGIAAASRNLAFFLVGIAWIVLIGLVIYKGVYQGRYLPQFVLDAIARRERREREAAIKEASSATSRNLRRPARAARCVACGEPATAQAYFAQSY